MTKKLFLCTFTLCESRYMVDGHEDSEHSRIVWAESPEAAEEMLGELKEFKTDEYAVYRSLCNFEATEAMGSPE